MHFTEKGLIVDEILCKSKGEIAETLVDLYAELRRKDGDFTTDSEL